MTVAFVDVFEATDGFNLASDQFPAVVGRHSEAAIRIVDRFMSRRHCHIDIEDGQVVVRDLDSTHGTFVNREQITEAVLAPGDQLQIGVSLFRVEYDSDAVAAWAETTAGSPAA